ncbi:MAG: three-Cys-motif partner protein TcmP [Deltaproteobacteria bacterium]|nr:three-Cys-motif partner protein TcmP [Deltaproteobacteria bacterium]
MILQRHLDAWLPIMTRSFRKLLYVDGFAGPGVYEGGEPGSPIIALRAAILNRALRNKPPDCELGFLFIEERVDRVAALREEVKKLLDLEPLPGWLKYHIAEGEFEAEMAGSFDRWSLRGRRPMFVFIDPFGYSGLPMSLIKRIANVPHSECLITFTYKSINRWAIHGDPQKERHVDALYGTSSWRDCRGDEQAMVDLYRDQLLAEGGFKYNCTFKMKDRLGVTEYFLAFGTNEPKGLTVMKAATWKADPRTGRVFSDADDPDQLFLDLPLDPLREILQCQFRGCGWVSTEDVIEFVRHTAYSEEKHLYRNTLGPMERERLLEVDRVLGSRKGTFKGAHRLRFV